MVQLLKLNEARVIADFFILVAVLMFGVKFVTTCGSRL